VGDWIARDGGGGHGLVAASTMSLGFAEWLGLFGHFILLSLLSVGGAIVTAPDMHRYLVGEQLWLTDAQFTASVALAQAAPGPNVLFVAVLGWNVAGPMGMLATLTGILLPSTLLTLGVSRWGSRRRDTPGIRAFTSGMSAITLGLLLATGWMLAQPAVWPASGHGGVPVGAPWHSLVAAGLIAVTVVAMLRTRWSPMWLVALGAGVGAMGWV
jgi:chromate transporter